MDLEISWIDVLFKRWGIAGQEVCFSRSQYLTASAPSPLNTQQFSMPENRYILIIMTFKWREMSGLSTVIPIHIRNVMPMRRLNIYIPERNIKTNDDWGVPSYYENIRALWGRRSI